MPVTIGHSARRTHIRMPGSHATRTHYGIARPVNSQSLRGVTLRVAIPCDRSRSRATHDRFPAGRRPLTMFLATC